MKTYKEFLNEARPDSEFVKSNQGREGKPIIDANGNEVKGSTVLGVEKDYISYVIKTGSLYSITVNSIFGEEKVDLDKNSFSMLKRVK